jgi:hypothetical protein
MVVGGTFRDVAVRRSSTRDIDIVLAKLRKLTALLRQVPRPKG